MDGLSAARAACLLMEMCLCVNISKYFPRVPVKSFESLFELVRRPETRIVLAPSIHSSRRTRMYARKCLFHRCIHGVLRAYSMDVCICRLKGCVRYSRSMYIYNRVRSLAMSTYLSVILFRQVVDVRIVN